MWHNVHFLKVYWCQKLLLNIFDFTYLTYSWSTFMIKCDSIYTWMIEFHWLSTCHILNNRFDLSVDCKNSAECLLPLLSPFVCHVEQYSMWNVDEAGWCELCIFSLSGAGGQRLIKTVARDCASKDNTFYCNLILNIKSALTCSTNTWNREQQHVYFNRVFHNFPTVC